MNKKIIDQNTAHIPFSGSQLIDIAGLDLKICLRDNAQHFFKDAPVERILTLLETHIERFRSMDVLGLPCVNILPPGHDCMGYPGVNLSYDAFVTYSDRDMEHIIFTIRENRKIHDLFQENDLIRNRDVFVKALKDVTIMFD